MGKKAIEQIEGYADMTAEEKLAAIEALELEEPDLSGYIEKTTFDKTASDLAKLKKELRAKDDNSSEEQKQLEALQASYDALKKESDMAKNKSKFLALGYDEKLAEDTATAVVEGDFDKVLSNQQSYLKMFEKKVKSEVLKSTPEPEGGSGKETVMTLEKFKKLPPKDRLDFSKNKPDEYKALYSGESAE